MNLWEVLLGAVLGLLLTEFTDVSPWLAKRLVRRAAYWWSADRDVATAYVDEWMAVIEQRPGKLLKLGTALSFLGGAVLRTIPRSLCGVGDQLRDRSRVLRVVSTNVRFAVAVFRAAPWPRKVAVPGMFAVGLAGGIVADVMNVPSTIMLYTGLLVIGSSAALSVLLYRVARRHYHYHGGWPAYLRRVVLVAMRVVDRES